MFTWKRAEPVVAVFVSTLRLFLEHRREFVSMEICNQLETGRFTNSMSIRLFGHRWPVVISHCHLLGSHDRIER